MARRSDGLRTERRILSVCVRLFLENGYHGTTMQQICREAQVSPSSFQNLFGKKDGVLLELLKTLYEYQFEQAGSATGSKEETVYTYAAETAIQLAITEINENIRDCYLESYTYQETLDYIQKKTAKRLLKIFGPYQPELDEQGFYVLDFGSAGLMRAYMANPCTEDFPLEEKVRAFLLFTLRGYKVPEDEVQKVLSFVGGMDLHANAEEVLGQLFRLLSVHYDFSLDGLLPEA